MRIIWEGLRPPNAAERTALANAYASGQIRNGDRVRPGRMNPRGARAETAYEQFHWGNPPRKRRRVRLPNYSELFELGKLKRVEYETRKGRERAIWVHDFSSPYPTLTATPRGRLGPIVGGRAIVTERGIER